MTGFAKWSDTGHKERAEQLSGGPDAFDEGARRLVAEARAWRLVEMRHERGLTQVQLADRMGVSKGRVSQIESGQVSGSDIIARYVRALGGDLIMVAVFDDGEFRKVG